MPLRCNGKKNGGKLLASYRIQSFIIVHSASVPVGVDNHRIAKWFLNEGEVLASGQADNDLLTVIGRRKTKVCKLWFGASGPENGR